MIGADTKQATPKGVHFCQKLDYPDMERMYNLETVGVQAPNCTYPKDILSQEH